MLTPACRAWFSIAKRVLAVTAWLTTRSPEKQVSSRVMLRVIEIINSIRVKPAETGLPRDMRCMGDLIAR